MRSERGGRDACWVVAMSRGSAEAMRRINEAYQLLKELYRPSGDPPEP